MVHPYYLQEHLVIVDAVPSAVKITCNIILGAVLTLSRAEKEVRHYMPDLFFSNQYMNYRIGPVEGF